MMCPEKGAPERLYGACSLKDLAGHGRVSEKEFLSGRKRAAAKPRHGTRTALYMRVSTADQKHHRACECFSRVSSTDPGYVLSFRAKRRGIPPTRGWRIP